MPLLKRETRPVLANVSVRFSITECREYEAARVTDKSTMVLGAYRQVVGWRDDLKTLTADEPAIAKAMAGKLQMDADKDKNPTANGPAFSRSRGRGTTAWQARNEREAKLQADGRKKESYYFEPAKISLGPFSRP